jgi:hypothetical protein
MGRRANCPSLEMDTERKVVADWCCEEKGVQKGASKAYSSVTSSA